MHACVLEAHSTGRGGRRGLCWCVTPCDATQRSTRCRSCCLLTHPMVLPVQVLYVGVYQLIAEEFQRRDLLVRPRLAAALFAALLAGVFAMCVVGIWA